jgi:uncharacterized protein YbjT (DUF2867 family)
MLMILITGGTGNSGRAIVKALLDRAERLRVLARDPAKAAVQLGDEVEIARGDFTDPMSIEAAMEDVDRALLLSPPSDRLVEFERAFVDAAKKCRVKHVVKFSAFGADANAPAGFSKWHGESEEYLKRSGLAWTILRPPFFMQNLFGLASMIQNGTIYQPAGEGKAGHVDVRDIAAVAAAALSEEGHEGKTYEITGPELLSFHDIAAAFSEILGRPIAYVDVPPEAAKQSMMQSGMPEWQADAINVLMADLRAGVYARLTDIVQTVGGKNPTTLARFIAENSAAFRTA